jgi:SH3-like domain-containing protein
MNGTELICLEPKADAKARIGAKDQWIHVQDPNGDQGYVAAWYVSETRGRPAAAGAMPVPASTTSAVSTSSPLAAGALALYPVEELALRTQPVIAPETLLRRVPVTEQLICVEPAKQAIPKVGMTGQWLKVRDASNKEGYVAACYVKYPSGSAAQSQQTTVAASAIASANGGMLKVRASAEGVALRNQPVVSDATLIKRLPLGTVLTITEPNAETKIGRNDQWLKVKDPTGLEGVVAAWFVAR